MTSNNDLRPAPPRPGVRFLLAHPAHAIALGFGAGLSPLTPGTVGTLWAWLAWNVLTRWVTSPLTQGLIVAATFVIGTWAAAVTARDLGDGDPGSIVVDEVMAFWLVLWIAAPVGFGAQFAAFLLFRLFDIWKPGPIRAADRRFHGFGWRGGFGVMFDDFLAGCGALLTIALWRWFVV